MNLVIDPQLPANVFAGTLADGVYKSPDGGRRWLPRNAGIQKGTISANVNQLVFDPIDSQILYAGTTVGVFQTMDAGQSWTERMRGMTEINSSWHWPSIRSVPISSTRGRVAGSIAVLMAQIIGQRPTMGSCPMTPNWRPWPWA